MNDVACEQLPKATTPSIRAVVAVFAAIVMIAIPSPSRCCDVPMGTPEATMSWVAGVIGVTFGISSICRREPLWLLSLIAVALSVMPLIDVVRFLQTHSPK